MSLSLSSNSLEESIIYIIKSASIAKSLAFFTPILSTTSLVSLIPAVSIIFKLIPSIFICSSNVSLVVPAISVTIALSVPTTALRNEDLPAFGLPNITVLIPSDITLPLSEALISLFNSSIIFFVILQSLSSYPSKLICSGSSNAASINAISFKILSLISLIFVDIPPFN